MLMSEVVRLYKCECMLSSRTAIFADKLMTALKVSRATLKRDTAKLREPLHAPITFHWELGSTSLGHWSIDSSSDQRLDPPLHRLQLRQTQPLSMSKRVVGAGAYDKRTAGNFGLKQW